MASPSLNAGNCRHVSSPAELGRPTPGAYGRRSRRNPKLKCERGRSVVPVRRIPRHAVRCGLAHRALRLVVARFGADADDAGVDPWEATNTPPSLWPRSCPVSPKASRLPMRPMWPFAWLASTAGGSPACPLEPSKGFPCPGAPRRWICTLRTASPTARSEELPLTRATLHGEVVADEEWVLGRPTGERVPVLCNAGPIHDPDGHIVGGVLAFRDISALKEVERERERLLVEVRPAALRDANRLLREQAEELKKSRKTSSASRTRSSCK